MYLYMIIIIFILLILLLIVYLFIDKIKLNKFTNQENKLDLVVVTYNDKMEMNLLKLQAYSMIYIDYNMVNRIIIVYNDISKYDFTEIINCYPEKFRSKIKIINVLEIDPRFTESNWTNQQIVKLLIVKYVESDYYLILDAKNHFVKNIDSSDYFYNNKPKLFVENPGPMIKHYYNSLNYFKIKCPFSYDEENGSNILLTTTPYLLCKKDVEDLIKFIEKKENTSFIDFFYKNKYIKIDEQITEFYLYSTYLIYTDRIKNYHMSPRNYTCIMNDPSQEWNKFEIHKNKLNDPLVKTFGIHRTGLKKMNREYKIKLMTLYSKYYDFNICNYIKMNILEI
jgi:hypothetical protein